MHFLEAPGAEGPPSASSSVLEWARCLQQGPRGVSRGCAWENRRVSSRRVSGPAPVSCNSLTFHGSASSGGLGARTKWPGRPHMFCVRIAVTMPGQRGACTSCQSTRHRMAKGLVVAAAWAWASHRIAAQWSVAQRVAAHCMTGHQPGPRRLLGLLPQLVGRRRSSGCSSWRRFVARREVGT